MKKELAIANCYFGTAQDEMVLLDQTGDCNEEALKGLLDVMAETKQKAGKCLVLIDLKDTAGFSARRAAGGGQVTADAVAFVGGSIMLRTAVTVAHRAMTLRGASWKLSFFKTREEALSWLNGFK